MTEKRDVTALKFRVTATIPETELRREFNEMVAEGYSGSWGDYLREQREAFLNYASGWWTIDAITWKAGPSTRIEAKP